MKKLLELTDIIGDSDACIIIGAVSVALWLLIASGVIG